MIRACSEAWDLSAKMPTSSGAWYITDNLPLEFYHLISQVNNTWRAHVFFLDQTSRRLITSPGSPWLLTGRPMSEARIVLRNGEGKVAGFNPRTTSDADLLFPFGTGRVRDLGFDPMEWSWRKMGAMKKEPFFSYSTKRRYRIIIQAQHRQLLFDQRLEAWGYSIQQRRDFFKKLWHH